MAMPPTIGVGQGATKPVVNREGYRVFRLLEDLREGTLHDELQELYKKMKKPVQARIDIDENLAGAVAHFMRVY